jgi:hypothetical protein
MIAVDIINKEPTPEGSFEPAAPFLTFHLVNGRLMANQAISPT